MRGTRGSTRSRLRTAPWDRNELWRRAQAIPSLDQRFAEDKSLVDHISGQNLITFTRASSATFVGSNGVLRTAVTNLLLRSEEFGTTWATGNSSVSPNAVVSPAGTLTADKLVEDTSASTFHRIQQSAALQPGSITYSVYLKAAERSFALLVVFNATNGRFIDVKFNLGNGTVDTNIAGSASVTAAGDGWYRCSVTATATVAANNIAYVYISNVTGGGSSYESYTGNGTSGIYLWGAQLEQSTTAGEYVPTGATINSAPRFDHNPLTGESLGLLVEEQRTNLCLQSENLGTTWTTAAVSVTVNQRSAPDGTLSMDTVTATGGAGFLQQAITVTNSTVYTASIYVYAASNRTRIIIHNGASDICNIAWTSISGGTTSVSGTASNITSTHVGNNIYRLSFTFTSTSTTANYRIQPLDGSGNAVSGATGDFWGAQLEVGGSPSSYIGPTTTAAVTRAADVASITGSNFSSWYRQDEGTVFADFLPHANTTFGAIYLNNGTVTEAIRVFYNSAVSNYTFSVRTANSEQSSINNLGVYVLQSERISAAYKMNDLAASRNGGASILDTSATLPTGIDRLDLGTTQSSNYLNGHIRRLTCFPQRLPNSVLQSLTS